MGWEVIDFLFVLQIGMTVKVAKKGSVDPIRISIFKQIPFFFVLKNVCTDRNFVHVLLLKTKEFRKRSL